MSDNTEIDWSPPMPDDQMAAAYQSVQAKLTHTAGGEVRNTLQNFVTALTHDPVFAGNIRRNLFKERMSMTCPVWWARKSDMIDDMDAAFLRLYLEEHYGLRSEKLIYPALNIVSTAQAFHPVRDRLNSLVWDGAAPFSWRGSKRHERKVPAYIHARRGKPGVLSRLQV